MKEKLLTSVKRALRPLRPVWEREFNRQLQQRTGLIPIDQTRPEDIFVVGYPKSGNTWMQYLIAGLIFGMDIRLVPDALVLTVVPDVHFVRYYRRYLSQTFFKTHDLPRPYHRRVVYLVRDGRDVMVSYLHHLTALAGQVPDLQNIVATGEGLFPSRWHEHVESWLANPYGAELITISYEALKKNTGAELQRLCEFAGLQRNRELLEMVASTCSFNSMREKEQKQGWDERTIWPKDKAFVRRGVVGSFKDEMPPAALETFMQMSSTTLKRIGYID